MASACAVAQVLGEAELQRSCCGRYTLIHCIGWTSAALTKGLQLLRLSLQWSDLANGCQTPSLWCSVGEQEGTKDTVRLYSQSWQPTRYVPCQLGTQHACAQTAVQHCSPSAESSQDFRGFLPWKAATGPA